MVWHNSFHELLATICTLSKIGHKIKCADGEVRHLFPAILMLSADYEEQYNWPSICLAIQSNLCYRCIMGLTRGKNGDFPCPICLVPRGMMCTGAVGDLRTTEDMREIYNMASKMDTAREREELLKGYSTRYIEVCKVYINQWFICII